MKMISFLFLNCKIAVFETRKLSIKTAFNRIKPTLLAFSILFLLLLPMWFLSQKI